MSKFYRGAQVSLPMQNIRKMVIFSVRKTDRTVGLDYLENNSSIQPYDQFSVYQLLASQIFLIRSAPGFCSFALSVGPFSSLKLSFLSEKVYNWYACLEPRLAISS